MRVKRSSGRARERPARVIESATVTIGMGDHATTTNDRIGPGATRHPLSFLDRALWVPLGFLWLIILVLVAVPVTIYMTLLYYVVSGVKTLSHRLRPRRGERDDAEEPAA